MKYILKEITPLGKNDLFIANYWPDNQMDFPLHFHEDYELCLTLNVRGKRILGNLVEDFTEKTWSSPLPTYSTATNATTPFSTSAVRSS